MRERISFKKHKVVKERLPFLVGANASEDFKLKALLRCLSENPRCPKELHKKQFLII